MSQDFERAKAFLKQANPNGETLYDHLTQVLLQIAKDKPENVLEDFEKISVQVKRAALDPNRFPEIPSNTLKPAENRQILSSIENLLSLVKSVPPVTSADLKAAADAKHAQDNKDEDAEEEDVKKLVQSLLPAFLKGAKIPDMMQHAELLSWAGVNMGQEEMYKVQLSIHELARREGNFAEARFFGKILGTQKDYYIAEAKLAEYPKEDTDPQTKREPIGTGANTYVYFATNAPEQKWTRLPNVLPEQIVTSRLMRRYFSGVLSAPVLGYPRFPWPEACYLRAQIARIASATVVSPKGFYTMVPAEDEDAPEVMAEDEEFEALDAEALKEAENWCHHVGHLLKQGRAQPWAPPEGEEEEEEPPAEEEEEAEPEEPLPMHSGLEGDALPAKEGEEEEEEEEKPKLWRFSTFPADTLHRASAAISLNWPGAHCVVQGKRFANIYVGFGQKQLQTLYAPPPPPMVQKEYVSAFNPEEAEEGEVDPMIEQIDPAPPKADDDGGEGDEGDGGDDDDEE
jgi:radial spoke head protein 4A